MEGEASWKASLMVAVAAALTSSMVWGDMARSTTWSAC